MARRRSRARSVFIGVIGGRFVLRFAGCALAHGLQTQRRRVLKHTLPTGSSRWFRPPALRIRGPEPSVRRTKIPSAEADPTNRPRAFPTYAQRNLHGGGGGRNRNPTGCHRAYAMP